MIRGSRTVLERPPTGPCRLRPPYRRTLLVALALCATGLAAACSPGSEDPPAGQRVEIVAGGGTPAGASIDGELKDFAVDSAGAVHVLTATGGGLTMWTLQGGSLGHVAVDLDPRGVAQVAAAPDGSVYVASKSIREGLWKVGADGGTTRIAPGPVTGVAVSPSGQVYFAESHPSPDDFQLVRTIDGGTIRTVFGRDLTHLKPRDWADASVTTGFPAGTKATDLALDDTQAHLAVGKSGEVYAVTGEHRAVYANSQGVAVELASSGGSGLGSASTPFAKRGSAGEADFLLTDGLAGPSITTDPKTGDVYVLDLLRKQGEPRAFNWSGDYTSRQKDLIDSRDYGHSTYAAIQRIDPSGALSTAAYGAVAAAVNGDWLYLATRTANGNSPQVLIARTPIPR
ncbi:MAG: hypothetical protein JWO79_4488 [Actinomycetia bacterium]|nr:hypothetical protein [Actinomycetes bacterium]MDQ1653006.1 hypothetical protein [Cryptosporangiaceae bacterium]